MRKGFRSLAILIGCCAASPTLASTIAQIEAMSSGTLVTLNSNPVITAELTYPAVVNGKTYSNYAFLATDGTGGADLFGALPSGSTYVPAVGDEISAAGTYSPFDSIPEIEKLTSLTQVSSGNPVPAPLTLTIAQLQTTATNAILGYPVQINNVTFVSPPATYTAFSGSTAENTTLTATDGQGNNLTVFVYASSYVPDALLSGLPIPTGPVDMSGFVDVFDGANEFVPQSITAVPEPASLSVLALGGLALMGRRRKA